MSKYTCVEHNNINMRLSNGTTASQSPHAIVSVWCFVSQIPKYKIVWQKLKLPNLWKSGFQLPFPLFHRALKPSEGINQLAFVFFTSMPPSSALCVSPRTKLSSSAEESLGDGLRSSHCTPSVLIFNFLWYGLGAWDDKYCILSRWDFKKGRSWPWRAVHAQQQCLWPNYN